MPRDFDSEVDQEDHHIEERCEECGDYDELEECELTGAKVCRFCIADPNQ